MEAMRRDATLSSGRHELPPVQYHEVDAPPPSGRVIFLAPGIRDPKPKYTGQHKICPRLVK